MDLIVVSSLLVIIIINFIFSALIIGDIYYLVLNMIPIALNIVLLVKIIKSLKKGVKHGS